MDFHNNAKNIKNEINFLGDLININQKININNSTTQAKILIILLPIESALIFIVQTEKRNIINKKESNELNLNELEDKKSNYIKTEKNSNDNKLKNKKEIINKPFKIESKTQIKNAFYINNKKF